MTMLDLPGFQALANATFQDLAAPEVDQIFVACCEHERKERLRKHEATWQTVAVAPPPRGERPLPRSCYFHDPDSQATQWGSPFANDDAGPSAEFGCESLISITLGRGILRRSREVCFARQEAATRVVRQCKLWLAKRHKSRKQSLLSRNNSKGK